MVVFAGLAALFLADAALSVRFRFPGGSVGRGFFFNPLVELSAFASPVVVAVAYRSLFRRISPGRRLLYGALLVPPVLWVIYVVLFAVRFTTGEPA